MTQVFLDTVGLLAVWDRRDQWHEAADRAYRSLLFGDVQLLTTSFVLTETGNAAARRPYRDSVLRLRRFLEEADALTWPTSEDWSTAWDAYARGDAGGAGIVDQISFVVMRRLGITKALTNDRHFRAAGFETLF